MDARHRPIRENRDALAVSAWQYANDFENFIPTPLGEAKRWLGSVAAKECLELLESGPSENIFARHAKTILEELELN